MNSGEISTDVKAFNEDGSQYYRYRVVTFWQIEPPSVVTTIKTYDRAGELIKTDDDFFTRMLEEYVAAQSHALTRRGARDAHNYALMLVMG